MRGATPVYFIPDSFRLCLNCGVYYAGRQSDAGKLTSLESGGRSSATSLLGLATIKALRGPLGSDLGPEARKLLSFYGQTGRMHRSRPDTSTISSKSDYCEPRC